MIKVTYMEHMGSDLSVVNAARVSFNNWSNSFDMSKERNIKLIKYLAKHKHMSPFGHCFAKFHVRAPIFVARQLVKHKFLRWNEMSRRYVDTTPNWYRPDMNDENTALWRKQTKDKKQGSGGVLESETEQSLANFELNHVIAEAMQAYQRLLEMGVCEEQARMVLPQSTMTEWYWSGSLDAFTDMCHLRLKADTQYETQVVATKIAEHLEDIYPVSWQALMEGNKK